MYMLNKIYIHNITTLFVLKILVMMTKILTDLLHVTCPAGLKVTNLDR